MKRTKEIFTVSFSFLSLIISGVNLSAQAISDHFFGQNAWMPYAIGTTVLNGKLDQNWANIRNSRASIIRYGGITGDKEMPTNAQYIGIIDSIRANGMEPVIQVPFYNYRFTAQQAAGIVNYINVIKGRNVQYWIIGNEPDLGYSFTTASQVANYLRPFSSAMKSVDPSIKIIGPECAWFNQGIINGLTTPNGPDDVTGKDAAGRYYLDIISFHTYPFNGTQTRAQVVSKLTSAGSLQDNLVYLNNRVASCNTTHNRTGTSMLKTAITEANINWQNSTTDDLNGVGANSFLGGQFVAEMMGIGMKNSVDFINMWSVIEGNSTALNIGYLDRTTGAKKPLYYHFKLLAENFKGDVANCSCNQPNVKSFGSKDAQQVSVIILNEELTGTYNYTVRLNTTAIAGTNPLKINVNAGIASEYTGVIGNQSSILLTFNAQGTLIRKYEYSLLENAMLNLPPKLTEFPVLLPIELVTFTGKQEGRQNLLEWETASELNNNHFTVERQVDGNDFTAIGDIAGAGSSTSHHHYKAYDSDPENGATHYRLKQTDHNGAYSYSAVISVENVFDEESISSVYPNPAFQDVSLNFHSNGLQNIHIQIIDFMGRVVADEMQIVPEGSSVLNVKMNSLAKGLYSLRILDDKGRHIAAASVVKN